MEGLRRLLAILAVGVVPWTVVFVGGDATLVLSIGLLDPTTLTLTDVYAYTFVHTRGLPASLFAWPLGAALYLLALGSALLGTATGHEDRRVTAGLLVLVALTQLTVAWGLTTRLGTVAVPLGSVAALAVVALMEWPAIRGSVLPASR